MLNTFLSIGIDALAYSMVLFVISIGLSIMMGLMRVINLAHGAFAMIGGYIASFLLLGWGIGFTLALFLAVAITVVVAVPIEFALYRRIYNRSEPLRQILMTIGITFMIVGVMNYAFGPTMKPIPLPQAISGPIDIGFRVIPAHRLFVVIAGAIVAFALWLLSERSAFGVRMRAAVDNSAMAAALGLRTERIYSITFALAVALAAFGGVVGAELLPVEPNYALRYMVLFLVVVCVGGAGSILGTLVAALALGFIDTSGKYFAPEFGEFFFYIAVIGLTLLFPHGITEGTRR